MTGKEFAGYEHDHEGSSDDLEDVWALFAEDGREALDLAEETLLALERNPADGRQVAVLFRGLHTFKGNARVMGLSNVESLAHHAEDLVALIRDEGVRLTGGMVDLLLAVLDRARNLLEEAVSHRRDADDGQIADLVARLRATRAEQADRRSSPDADSPVEAVEPQEEPPEEETEDSLFIEPVDPATDPTYVRIFLEIAGEELDRLQAGVARLASRSRKEKHQAGEEIQAAAAALSHAAGRMGYVPLVDLLAQVSDVAEKQRGKRRRSRLNRLIQALQEGLPPVLEGDEEVQGAKPPAADDRPALDEADLGAWFGRRCREGALADLDRLRQAVDELRQGLERFWAGGSVLAWEEPLVAEVIRLLRGVYQDCVFHHLEPGAHLILALQDLYERVTQGHVVVSEHLLDLTHACAGVLQDALAIAYGGGEPAEQSGIIDLRRQAEKIILHTESRGLAAARQALAWLDLSPEFRSALTSESLLEVGRALQARKRFYTLLADLNEDEGLGRAFADWSQAGAVQLITSVTVFHDDRTLFCFLLATAQPREALEQALAGMDPEGRHLVLKACHARAGADLEEAGEDQAGLAPYPAGPRPEPRQAISPVHLTGLVESIGEMVASRATLHRVVERLATVDLVQVVAGAARRAREGGQRWSRELQVALQPWVNDVSLLSRLETEMGATLDRFQEMALALRARPAGEVLAPLQRLVDEVSRHQGKRVELDLEGMDVQLDHQVVDLLRGPLSLLTWFAVTHSIEKPVQRRDAGKSPVGHISVSVRKTAGRVRVVIEDDGRGLVEEVLLARAQELGWAGDGDGATAGRAGWIFEEEFGPVGGANGIAGVDLAEVGAGLRARRGRIEVSNDPGQGLCFSLDVPLDMVVIDGMVLRARDVNYVVPVEAIRRILQPEERRLIHSSAGGDRHLLRLEEGLVPLRALDSDLRGAPSTGLLVVVESGDSDVALAVDELVGQQQVLIQPLSGVLVDVPHVSGCALLGEGNVGMVLDLNRVGE